MGELSRTEFARVGVYMYMKKSKNITQLVQISLDSINVVPWPQRFGSPSKGPNLLPKHEKFLKYFKRNDTAPL